jgi:putative phosphoesterase
MVRALVLADTHLRPGRARTLPSQVCAELDRCDVLLHAGDVISAQTLDELAKRTTVHAVLGNNDRDLVDALAERVELTLGGVRLAMVHDSGTTKGRPGRMRKWFPDAQVVVFGHSHQPVNEWHDGQLLFNPGSPTERRRAPTRTYGILELAGGAVTRHQVVDLAEDERPQR